MELENVGADAEESDAIRRRSTRRGLKDPLARLYGGMLLGVLAWQFQYVVLLNWSTACYVQSRYGIVYADIWSMLIGVMVLNTSLTFLFMNMHG